MKRIVGIFLLLFMIFSTCVAFADNVAEPTALSTEQGAPTRATSTVYLEDQMVLAYECPVRQRYVQVTFADTYGPTWIRIGIKYLKEETGEWVRIPSGAVVDLNEHDSQSFYLPVDARYRVHVQKDTSEQDGYVVLHITAHS